MWRWQGEEEVGDRPIRVFHGAADDWTPVAPCREYVARVRRAGKDIALIEYPGARHSFDNPALSASQLWEQALNPTPCAWAERPDGRIIERGTGREADLDSPCFSRGATLGYDPRAHRQAIQDVKAFLSAVFKMSRLGVEREESRLRAGRSRSKP